MQRQQRSTIRGLLDAIAEGPPQDVGEKWFHQDLLRFSLEELSEELRRLELSILFIPRQKRADWPACWVIDRLERVQALLRKHHAAAAWSRARVR